MVFIGRRKNVI